jgi:hypothetical protein
MPPTALSLCSGAKFSFLTHVVPRSLTFVTYVNLNYPECPILSTYRYVRTLDGFSRACLSPPSSLLCQSVWMCCCWMCMHVCVSVVCVCLWSPHSGQFLYCLRCLFLRCTLILLFVVALQPQFSTGHCVPPGLEMPFSHPQPTTWQTAVRDPLGNKRGRRTICHAVVDPNSAPLGVERGKSWI